MNSNIEQNLIPLVNILFSSICQKMSDVRRFYSIENNEFTLVNDCFQCKNNEADGVFMTNTIKQRIRDAQYAALKDVNKEQIQLNGTSKNSFFSVRLLN